MGTKKDGATRKKPAAKAKSKKAEARAQAEADKKAAAAKAAAVPTEGERIVVSVNGQQRFKTFTATVAGKRFRVEYEISGELALDAANEQRALGTFKTLADKAVEAAKTPEPAV
jgi:hypothetical protein